MPMPPKTSCHSLPVPQELVSRRQPLHVFSELQSAVEELERALEGLQSLSGQAGYEFIDRMLPGYTWAIEQIQELNTSLVFKLHGPRVEEE